MKRKFSIRLPIQFRDLDVAGHVNHATYLQYMETARVEFLQNVSQIDIFNPRMILASARCEYYRPIINERRVTITVWVSRIGNGSWDFDYTIESLRKLHAKGRTIQVAYDYDKRLPIRITEDLRRALKAHFAKPLRFRGQR